MNRSELNHIRTTLTGTRSLLAAYFYGNGAMFELMRQPGLNCNLNHECGGVMDHLANIIEALDEAIGDGEPGDREPNFPAPEPVSTDSTCPHCGGSMLGDGCTTVMHCERVDLSLWCAEPDSGPIFCDPKNPND